jgi:gp16 family phage-associated protein
MAQQFLTGEQVKQRFRMAGKPVAEWARDHNFRPSQVYRVLNGYDAGDRGDAHRIAVLLGMKPSTSAAAA